MSDIKEKLNAVLSDIAEGNNFGEKITLLGATKYVSMDKITEACENGLAVIGENHAQEFRDKFPFYPEGVEKHFIGTLQFNKLKYVVGKADSIDSVSSLDMAKKINDFAAKKGVIQNIMPEINAGCEASKTGMTFDELKRVFDDMAALPNLKIIGIMAMLPITVELPITADAETLAGITRGIRAFYDEKRKNLPDMKYLSIGMTGDYKIAIANGSNMIRIGRAIFGQRY